jgi:rRNA maturation endonuclease Nob1
MLKIPTSSYTDTRSIGLRCSKCKEWLDLLEYIGVKKCPFCGGKIETIEMDVF